MIGLVYKRGGLLDTAKKKGKMHPCTTTVFTALYIPVEEVLPIL